MARPGVRRAPWLVAAALCIASAVASPAAAGATSTASTSAAAATAGSDARSEGRWWFDAFRVADAHQAGWTGSGVTIAIIDSQLNPELPTLAGADLRVQSTPECFADGVEVPPTSLDRQSADHATSVVSLLVASGTADDGGVGVPGVAPGVTVLFFRNGAAAVGGNVCDSEDGVSQDGIAVSMEAAIDSGADIISMSQGFGESEEVRVAVARALRSGIIVVTPVSNEPQPAGLDLWSTALNGVVSVQAIDADGAIFASEVGGETVPHVNPATDVAGPGVGILTPGNSSGWTGFSLSDGTSLATPIVAGFLAVTWQKYPDATANQLIQSLIRNTGAEDHPLEFDDSGQYGYGIASLTHLLREDPTQYPDVNPLITEDGDPSPELIANGGVEPTAAPTVEPGAGDGDATALVPILIAVGVGALVLVALVVVLVVVLARRAVRRDGARG